MNKPSARSLEKGPFCSDQLTSGDSYELSNGHPIYCSPTGGRGSRANLVGGAVLDSDPAVESAGVDTGFSPESGMLWAPDVSVGGVTDKPGWVKGVPPLAVEYADTGQNENELAEKISDLLDLGTQIIWVIRLSEPRRVEVYERGKKMYLVQPGDVLKAPGILKNPVSVLSLYDREAAHDTIFLNLLQRKGYESLDAVLAEGKAEGIIEGKVEGKLEGKLEGEIISLKETIIRILLARNISVTPRIEAALSENNDPASLKLWASFAATVDSADDILVP